MGRDGVGAYTVVSRGLIRLGAEAEHLFEHAELEGVRKANFSVSEVPRASAPEQGGKHHNVKESDAIT